MPFRQLGNIGVEKIPGVSARAIQDNGRLEGRGVVEAADIDADELRLLVRLVVDRHAANGAKAFALGGAAVGSSRDLAHLAGEFDGASREYEHRAVPAAGVPLAIPAV